MSDSLLHAQLSLFYQGRAYAPAWLTEDGVSSLAEDYLKELDSVYFDGLDPTDYNIFKRDSTLSRFKGSQELSASDWAQFDYLLSKSLLRVSHDLVLGRYYELNLKNKNWKNINDTTYVAVEAMAKTLASQDMNEAFRFMRPHHPWYHAYRKEYIWLEQRKAKSNLPSFTSMADSLSVGMNSPQLANLREFLHEIIQLPLDTSMAVCDQKLIDMLKAFQYRHQVKTTGKLDSATCNRLNKTPEQRQKMLAINMERMRWLRHTFQQPYIWSVLPRMDVEYVEHDSIQFRMRTVIGRPARATLTLDTKLENIVFSPPWIVPPTILKEDVLPGLSRRGGSYLARKGLRAYDRRGRQVSASAINGSNYRNFSFGQAPGYNSSLGEIKFNMPNPWSIYMHDTPHREDFVKFFRAYSSGCVRVHKPKEFATFLLRDSANYSYSKVDSICKLRKTIFVPMKRNINVHFVYLTTAIDSTGNMMYLNDVYKWDDKIIGMK
jgi:murein L,D-transpeptidase YcbB/YkuD